MKNTEKEFSSHIINLNTTTLDKIEAETIETFSNLEQAKTLQSSYQTKSFFFLGASAIGLSLGVSGLGASLFSNIDNALTVGVLGTFMTAISTAGVSDGLTIMQKSQLEAAKTVCFTEKINMLRNKLTNNTPNINKPTIK